MSGRGVVLDTSVLVGYFRNKRGVVNRVEALGEVYVPAIAVGELHFGAVVSAQTQANLAILNRFLSLATILDCTARTATYYAAIRAQLKGDGHPIPDNDIWIAAAALEDNLALISTDQHFDYVKGLRHEKW